jgi:hypothetical protein
LTWTGWKQIAWHFTKKTFLRHDKTSVNIDIIITNDERTPKTHEEKEKRVPMAQTLFSRNKKPKKVETRARTTRSLGLLLSSLPSLALAVP